VWMAKMAYTLTAVMVYTGTANVLPYPNQLPPEIFRVLAEVPFLVIPYGILLLAVVLTILSSIRGGARGQRKSFEGQWDGPLLVGALSSGAVASFFPHYSILILPVTFSLGLVTVVAAVLSYCRHRWKGRTVSRLLLLFAVSLAVLTVFQTTYSRRQLHSFRTADRTTAFEMCLYVFEREAFASYQAIDGDFPKRRDLLIPMLNTLMENEGQARKLDPLWRKEFAEGDRFQRAVAVTMLSMEGPDGRIASALIDRLERDLAFREGLRKSEWAGRLMLLTPADQQVETITRLLYSEQVFLRHVGYYCVGHHPDNALIQPLLLNIQLETDTKESLLGTARRQLDLITLHEIVPQIKKAADIPRAVAEWEQWAERNANRPFEDRLNLMLKTHGIQVPYSSLSNEDLFRMYNLEKDSQEPRPDEFLRDLLRLTLQDRLQVPDGFGYFGESGDRMGILGGYSTYLLIEGRVLAGMPVWHRIAYWF
jgi:hypothetical protein